MRPLTLGFSLFVAVGLLPGAAQGHKPLVVRELVVQLDDQGAVALWHVVLPETKARLFQGMVGVVARASGDASGELQQQLLATTLIKKAAQGVEIRLDGKPLATNKIDTRLTPQKNRSLDAAGLATLAGMPKPDGGNGTHELTIRLLPGQGELAVQIQTLGTWRLTQSDRGTPAADDRGLRGPVFLREGDQIRLQVQQLPTQGKSSDKQ